MSLLTKGVTEAELAAEIALHAVLDTAVHQAGADVLATDADIAADIAVHGALDTDIHGAGDLYLAYFADQGIEVSRIRWRAAYIGVVDVDGNDPACDWTAVDITGVTSARAKFAILECRFLVGTTGTSGVSQIQVRPKGSSDGIGVIAAQCTYWMPNGHTIRNDFIVGLDSGQEFEYKITEAVGGAGYAIDLACLGYVE